MHKQNKKKNPITTTSQLAHLRLVVIFIDPKKKTDKLTPERCHDGSLINP